MIFNTIVAGGGGAEHTITLSGNAVNDNWPSSAPAGTCVMHTMLTTQRTVTYPGKTIYKSPISDNIIATEGDVKIFTAHPNIPTGGNAQAFIMPDADVTIS